MILPNSKIILWDKPDGYVAFTNVIDGHGLTDEELIAQVQESHPDYTFRMVTNLVDMPIPYGAFFGALVLDQNNKFAHDMIKCREIWKDILRAKRTPKLQELDVAYQRADEMGDVELKREIALKKQALRDITDHPDIANAKNINDLRRFMPDILD